jgi:hypothetical protein
MKINTYKGIGYNELLFGFQFIDFAVMLLLSLCCVIFISFVMGAVVLVILFVFLKKQKDRPANHFRSLITFFVGTPYLSVSHDKVKPFILVIDNKGKTKK